MSSRESYPPAPQTAENKALGVGFERKLPTLRKGTVVEVWYKGRWCKAEITRPIPGPCYWARVISSPHRRENALVCLTTFGCVLGMDAPPHQDSGLWQIDGLASGGVEPS